MNTETHPFSHLSQQAMLEIVHGLPRPIGLEYWKPYKQHEWQKFLQELHMLAVELACNRLAL